MVDKYERAPGVVNRDVLDLDDLGHFELVVAISTLEHVGWDEEPRRPEAALDAVKRAARSARSRRQARADPSRWATTRTSTTRCAP